MGLPLQTYQPIVENSPDAISLTDARGEILYANAATAKLFGYKPEEIVGRNCLALIHPEDRDDSSRSLREVLRRPLDSRLWNARVRRPDGTYSWVETIVSNYLFESDVQALVMHQRDIDAFRSLEAERQSRAAQLTASNERLKDFAYTAAHDLREPLRAVSVYVEMLVQDVRTDARSKQMAQFVSDAVTRLTALVNDLLSFAATGVREPHRRVDLLDAMAEATQNLALTIKQSGAVVTVDRMPVVQGNRNRLMRLFQNLIDNAVRYRSQRPPEIHVGAEPLGRDWVVKVKDNGLGIAPAHQTRIFLPFIRLADRTIPGSGLGLAICKQIVEEMGGAIWVESELGLGSTFCFTIAASEESRQDDRPAS